MQLQDHAGSTVWLTASLDHTVASYLWKSLPTKLKESDESVKAATLFWLGAAEQLSHEFNWSVLNCHKQEAIANLLALLPGNPIPDNLDLSKCEEQCPDWAAIAEPVRPVLLLMLGFAPSGMRGRCSKSVAKLDSLALCWQHHKWTP